MRWHSTWAFLFLILIIAVAILYYFQRKSKTASLVYSNIDNIKKVPKGIRAYLSRLPLILRMLALVFAVLALARPQESDTKVKKNVEGIDIIVALDVSDSMLIEDMKPSNRLETSKETIRKFIDGRTSDKIGLVVFSGESYTRVPLTLDYALLKKSLSEVQTSSNIKMGTAIGVALANSVARIKDSTAESRVIIFLTDGENNSGTIDPITALDIAKGYGVKIYSIGMGVDGQAQLPYYINAPGGRKIKRYRPMHSKVNEELLTRLATETGGKFYRATTTQALENVFSDINSLEKTKIETNSFTRYTEHFAKFLWIAFFLYLTSVIIETFLVRRFP